MNFNLQHSLKIVFLFAFSIIILNSAKGVCSVSANFSYTDSMGHVKITNLSTGANRYSWVYNSITFYYHANPVFYFPTAGSYNILLIAYDSTQQNCFDSFSMNVQTNGACIASAKFTVSPDLTGKSKAVFNNTSVSNRMKQRWDYGDSSTSDTFRSSHTYPTPGTYNVRLIISDTLYNGCKDTLTQTVTVKDCYVKAEFSFTDTMFIFSFNNLSLNGSTNIWNFGDTTFSYSVHPTHTYTHYSVRYVTLIVRDTIYNMCADTITKPVMGVTCKSNSHFLVKGLATTPETREFISIYPYSNSFKWSFGDGTYSTERDPVHTYSSDGVFKVVLISSDTNIVGCIDTISLKIGIVFCGVKSDFSYTDSLGYFNFNNLSTGTITNYMWLFNDSGSIDTSYVTNPTKVFSTCRFVNVTLIAYNSNKQCYGIKSDYIAPALVKAKFSILKDTTQQYSGLIVDESEMSVNASYLWLFGDGDSSTSPNPSHTYTGSGPFSLQLHLKYGNCISNWADTVGFDSTGQLNLLTHPFTLRVVKKGGNWTSIKDSEYNESLNIYPNPSAENLNIASESEISIVKVYSLNGVCLNTIDSNSKRISIDVSDLNTGLYLIQVIHANGRVENRRFIKSIQY